MSRLDSFQSLPTACAAAASAVGAWWATAADVAMQVFGVPLPVLLASLTGALGARAFLPPQAFWRALCVTVLWTFAGAFMAQMLLWIATQWIANPPSGVLSGVALVGAFLGQRVMPIVWVDGGEALKRKLQGLFKGGDRG